MKSAPPMFGKENVIHMNCQNCQREVFYPGVGFKAAQQKALKDGWFTKKQVSFCPDHRRR